MSLSIIRSVTAINQYAVNIRRLKLQRGIVNHMNRRYIEEFTKVRKDNKPPHDHLLVLPESINQTSDENEILRIPKVGEPDNDFSKINTELAFKGLSQVICRFEDYLTDFENHSDKEYESLEEVFKDFEPNLIPLDCASNILQLLVLIDGSKYRHKEINELIRRFADVRERRTKNVAKSRLESMVRDMKVDQISEVDRAMLRFYEINTKNRKSRNEDVRLRDGHIKNLERDMTLVLIKLGLSNENCTHTIDDPDILATIAEGLDENQNLHHKERTPYVVTSKTYLRFMSICPDRFVRQGIWKAYNKRCSPKDIPKYNNIKLLDNIRLCRRKIADMDGYRTHLEYRLDGTMANSKQRVLESLNAIKSELDERFPESLQELEHFAMDNSFSDGNFERLEEYDIDYWVGKYIQDILVGVDSQTIRKYFPLETVLKGIRSYFETHFSLGIDIRPIEDNRFWEKGTLQIDLKRNATHLGSIIYDPYLRNNPKPGNMYYTKLRSRSPNGEYLPRMFMGSSFIYNPETGDTSMAMSDVLNLFYSFSTVIQELFYKFKYYELNVRGGLPEDVKKFLPNLCIGHMLLDHRILQSCSRRNDGKPIDSILANKLLKSYSYAKLFETWSELYKSHLDVLAHDTLVETKKIAKQAYSMYSPFPRDEDNYDFCAMTDVFVGPYDGLYYSNLWSKQLANFCLNHLKNDDGKLDDAKTKEFFRSLTESIFDSDMIDTDAKLLALTGKRFEPSKTGLGML